jgi:hypothetical protein
MDDSLHWPSGCLHVHTYIRDDMDEWMMDVMKFEIYACVCATNRNTVWL